jgi:hypothetical protein
MTLLLAWESVRRQLCVSIAELLGIVLDLTGGLTIAFYLKEQANSGGDFPHGRQRERVPYRLEKMT